MPVILLIPVIDILMSKDHIGLCSLNLSTLPPIFPNPPLLVLHPISTRVPLLEVTHPVSQPLPYLPAVPKLVGTFVHPMLHEMAQLIKHHPKESKEHAEETASHGLCGLSLP